jgi:hypothetical protein
MDKTCRILLLSLRAAADSDISADTPNCNTISTEPSLALTDDMDGDSSAPGYGTCACLQHAEATPLED